MYVQHNIEARSRNNFAVKNKKILHIMSVCFVALGIQHAKRMSQITFRLWPV
jgi:hypothetical protein